MIGSVTVVGASLAGLSAARALRSQGYDGTLTLVGAEPHLPYDRPPLSKGLLTGALDAHAITLLADDDADLAINWRLGVPAIALRPAERAVDLADGSRVTGDAVVLATGAAPRRLPGNDHLIGVHVLRTLDDALALREDLQPGAALVIVGAGFIGAEIAASARSLGLEVTVVEALPTPLAGPLGVEMGAAVAGLHAAHGVHLLVGTGVAELVGTVRVTAVRLTDGRTLPADVVVIGIGVRPNVDWLAGSGVTVQDGVVTDAGCATSVPNVVAVGDCASFYDVVLGRQRRIEHWTHALQQPATAASTLLTGVAAPYRALPYFWSEQYGRQIQFAGTRADGDVVTVVHGSIEEQSFVATYERAGKLAAVLGVAAIGPFTKWRRTLRTQHDARTETPTA